MKLNGIYFLGFAALGAFLAPLDPFLPLVAGFFLVTLVAFFFNGFCHLDAPDAAAAEEVAADPVGFLTRAMVGFAVGNEVGTLIFGARSCELIEWHGRSRND